MHDAALQPHPGAAPAVRRLLGFSGRQAACSVALLAALYLAARWLDARACFALFGAMLLPVLLCGSGLLAVVRLRSGWQSVWATLVPTLAASAVLAPPLYRHAIAIAGVRAADFSDVQIAAIVLAFGALVLALPLFYAQSQARTLYLADLRQAALSAELKALQAQIEPHFLYNTLANTRYLARHDADKAVRMLDHLIAYLHSALPDMRRAMSTLAREFTLAEHYLALMAIRYGERLSYHFDCPPALGDIELPPLMLMSLVENAVQHGVEPKPGAVRVSVAAALEDGRLRITVRDDGAGLRPGILGTGVGLRNLRQRLDVMYAGRAAFTLFSTDDQQTCAQLHLPLMPAATTTMPAPPAINAEADAIAMALRPSAAAAAAAAPHFMDTIDD